MGRHLGLWGFETTSDSVSLPNHNLGTRLLSQNPPLPLSKMWYYHYCYAFCCSQHKQNKFFSLHFFPWPQQRSEDRAKDSLWSHLRRRVHVNRDSKLCWWKNWLCMQMPFVHIRQQQQQQKHQGCGLIEAGAALLHSAGSVCWSESTCYRSGIYGTVRVMTRKTTTHKETYKHASVGAHQHIGNERSSTQLTVSVI